MFCTGDPDRPPVRCSEPSGYAHVGPEAAFAALTALWSGVPHRVDVSMQEVVFVANMTTQANFPETGFRGRRRGANIGRTREIWPTRDGYVSFGLRGGKARVPSLQLLTARLAAEGIPGADVLTARDWTHFSPATTTDDELKAIEAAGRRVLRAPHHAGALRPRVRDQPDARADQLATRDLRERAARGAASSSVRSATSSGFRARSRW